MEGSDTSGEMLTELERLRQREQELLRTNEEREVEFGLQRAKFIEMFRQKEDELRVAVEAAEVSRKNTVELEKKLVQLNSELDDVKTVAAIAEVGKEDDINLVERKCKEEVASLQQIMKETAGQIHERATSKYEAERMQWLKHQEKLEAELEELRSKISQEREGFLASITKTLQKKVAAVGSSRDEQDNLEQNMKKAHEDAVILRSVVAPLEEEIQSLKAHLQRYKDRGTDMTDKKDGVNATSGVVVTDGAIEEKVKELHHNLQTEKSSRTDLEMYVAVLNTQKNVLQDETDRLRLQLREVCKLLEQEKLEHTDLKRTWQMANDQFLEAQRLMMLDMRRVESVLSAEQQRQISEMKKLDTERDQMEKRVQELEEMRAIEQKEQAERRMSLEKSSSTPTISDSCSISHTGIVVSASTDSSTPGKLISVEDNDNDNVDHCAVPKDSPANSSTDQLLSRLQSSYPITSLTDAQQQSLLDPTPEAVASVTLLAEAKERLGCAYTTTIGKRIVSQKEWEGLEREVRAAREKVGRPCDMCSNYESQLQAVQEAEKKSLTRMNALERILQGERDSSKSHEKYTRELEENLKVVSEQAEAQILTLANQLREAEKFMTTVKTHFNQSRVELHEQLKSLKLNREEFQEQLNKLQDENDFLVGKHSKLAHEMQDENIEFPNSAEEMQLLLLKYREDIITVKVAHEHTAETLKSEIMFLKSQLIAEQTERGTIEESMTQEINQLHEQLAINNSIACEIDRLKAIVSEEEAARVKVERSEKECRDAVGRLRAQLQLCNKDKSNLEQEVAQLKAKVTSLQIDLDNSEVVQRDFVKLSQSLQIQLEKIRASEHEVRWQHEEDVDECANCKKVFSVTHRRHHCRHCGQIFCIDCLTKTVNSGPNLRPSKVCDVCHTILVRDATPYFSTESPRTPV